MHANESIESLLENYERSLLEAGVHKSETPAQLLADSFVEFGSSGRVYTKAQIIAALQAESTVKISVSQFNVRLLAPHIALVTYRAQRHTEPPVCSLRSSIWQQIEGKWQMVFHQGTLSEWRA